MNDSYGIGVEKGNTNLAMTMVFNQREVMGISQSQTLVKRNSTAIIIDYAIGINSQANQDCASLNMVIPEALVWDKEITLPYFYQELHV